MESWRTDRVGRLRTIRHMDSLCSQQPTDAMYQGIGPADDNGVSEESSCLDPSRAGITVHDGGRWLELAEIAKLVTDGK